MAAREELDSAVCVAMRSWGDTTEEGFADAGWRLANI